MDQKKVCSYQGQDKKIQEAWGWGGVVLMYAVAIETGHLMCPDTWPLGKLTSSACEPLTQQQILKVQNGLNLLLFQTQSGDKLRA